ncbi:MAG: cell division protein FtsZ [Rikenellaceae bacterium]|jgi:cell division protein FtsZ|nr:cell division protein FtsZ [Rikenellaceae bacterium]
MTDNIIKGLALGDVTRSIIMVAGVGGAGGNALNHMVELGINDVTFMACNTDAQALDQSEAAIKVQLGTGLGAGNKPEKGSQAAKESVDDIINVFRSEGIKMLFITAGMGGGTGTGASPIIAKAAQELDILTVAIVTTPFTNEGPTRTQQAQKGIEELRQYTDSLLVLSNDSIEELYGDLPYDEGFAKADDVLATAVKGIAEIITGHGTVNVDFADVNTVMRGSGRAFMGSARAGGPNRAAEAVEEAVTSLLLNYRDITGAKDILLNISYGDHTVTGREAGYVRGYLQERTGHTTNLIWGTAYKPSLGDELELTIVATGFEGEAGEAISVPKFEPKPKPVTAETEPAPTGFVRPPAPQRPAYEPPRKPSQFAQHGQPQQNSVVQWKGVDRYANIEHIVTVPAWIRNKAELSKIEVRASKTSLKGEPQPKAEAPAEQSGSLFDMPDE